LIDILIVRRQGQLFMSCFTIVVLTNVLRKVAKKSALGQAKDIPSIAIVALTAHILRAQVHAREDVRHK
jgi:hypothetical protein